MQISVKARVDLDDVWGDISNEELLNECRRRNIGAGSSEIQEDLESIAMEISVGNHPRAIDLTKEYIYQSCGRIVS